MLKSLTLVVGVLAFLCCVSEPMRAQEDCEAIKGNALPRVDDWMTGLMSVGAFGDIDESPQATAKRYKASCELARALLSDMEETKAAVRAHGALCMYADENFADYIDERVASLGEPLRSMAEEYCK